MPFSKLKADLRKAAERTIPRLRRRIARFNDFGQTDVMVASY